MVERWGFITPRERQKTLPQVCRHSALWPGGDVMYRRKLKASRYSHEWL